MPTDGYVRLYRKLLESDVAGDPNGLAVWVWCLLKASWKDTKYQGKQLISGQFVMGFESAAKDIGLPKSTFYDVIKRLEGYGYIRTMSGNQGTTVSVCNWGTYQNDNEDPRTIPGNQPETNRKPTEPIKKVRSKKEDPQTPKGDCPTVTEFFDRWNNFATLPSRKLKTCRKLTAKRKDKISTRLRDLQWFEDFKTAIGLLPLAGSGWQPTLDWLVANDHNVYRILEGEFEWRGSDDPALAKLQETRRKAAAAEREQRLEDEREQAKCLNRQNRAALSAVLNTENILHRVNGSDGEISDNSWLFGEDDE